MRDAVGEYPWLCDLIVEEGVSTEVNRALDSEKNILIEGTQGFGLSLYHSEYYPHATSRDTTAAAFLSEVGISPRMATEIIVVFRTFPIRVAGMQAGPLNQEITWEQIRVESGSPHKLDERTSVTNNIRRVARFDWDLARRAVLVNRPTRLAVNGLDYLNFGDFQRRDPSGLSPEAKDFIRRLQEVTMIPAAMLGTGPSLEDVIFIDTKESSGLAKSASHR